MRVSRHILFVGLAFAVGLVASAPVFPSEVGGSVMEVTLQYETRIKELSEDLADLRTRYDALLRRYEENATQEVSGTTEKDARIRKLELDIKESERVAARLKTVVMTMDEGGSERKKTIDTLTRQLEQIRAENAGRIKKLERQLVDAGAQDRQRAEVLAQKNTTLQKELTSEQQRSLELSRQIREKQAAVKVTEDLQVETVTQKAELEQMTKERDALKAAVAEMQKRLADSDLKSSHMKDAFASLDQAKAAVITARKESADAQSALVLERTKLSAAEERAVELEKERAGSKSGQQELQTRINDLTQSLAIAQSRERDATGALENLRAEYAQIAKESKRLAEEKKAVDATVQSLRASFEGDVVSERKKAESLAAELKKRDTERSSVESDRAALIAKISALESSAKGADARVGEKTAALDKIISSLRDDAFKKDQLLAQTTQRANLAEAAKAALQADLDAVKTAALSAQKTVTSAKAAQESAQSGLAQAIADKENAKAAFEKERDDYALLLSDREAELEKIKKADADIVKEREVSAKQLETMKRESDEKDLLLADLDKQVTDLSLRLKKAEASAAAKDAGMLELTAKAAEVTQLKARAEMDAKRASEAELSLASLKSDHAQCAVAAQGRESLIAEMRAKLGSFSDKYKAEYATSVSALSQKEAELAELKRVTAENAKASDSAQRAVVEEKTRDILALSRARDAQVAEIEQLKKRLAEYAQEKQEMARLLSEAKRQMKENIQKITPDAAARK